MKLTSALTIALLMGASSAFSMEDIEEEVAAGFNSLSIQNLQHNDGDAFAYLNHLQSTKQFDLLKSVMAAYTEIAQLNGFDLYHINYLKAALPKIGQVHAPTWYESFQRTLNAYQRFYAEKSKFEGQHRRYLESLLPSLFYEPLKVQEGSLPKFEVALKAYMLYYGQKEWISGFNIEHQKYLSNLLPSLSVGPPLVQEDFLPKLEDTLKVYNLYYQQRDQISRFYWNHQNYLKSLLPFISNEELTFKESRVRNGSLRQFEEALTGYNLYFSDFVKSLKSCHKNSLEAMLPAPGRQLSSGWLKAFQEHLEALKQGAAANDKDFLEEMLPATRNQSPSSDDFSVAFQKNLEALIRAASAREPDYNRPLDFGQVRRKTNFRSDYYREGCD